MVELEGIEPSSAKRLTTALRPFPCSSRVGWLTTGSVGLAPSGSSFRAGSGLSHRQRSVHAVNLYFCCRAVVVRPREPLLVTMSLYCLTKSGCESEVAIGASFGSPFYESEKLGSHVRLPISTSKPVSPLSMNCAPRRGGGQRDHAIGSRRSSARRRTGDTQASVQCRGQRRRLAAMARRASRSASRWAIT